MRGSKAQARCSGDMPVPEHTGFHCDSQEHAAQGSAYRPEYVHLCKKGRSAWCIAHCSVHWGRAVLGSTAGVRSRAAGIGMIVFWNHPQFQSISLSIRVLGLFWGAESQQVSGRAGPGLQNCGKHGFS